MASTTPLSVVIADDNRDHAESLAYVITLWGHDTYVCLEPDVALGYYTKFWPDVFLLDIGFPLRSDGLKVAREAKKLAKKKDSLIIAITGFSDEETQAQAKEAGFDHYLVKPIDLEKLHGLFRELHQQRAV